MDKSVLCATCERWIRGGWRCWYCDSKRKRYVIASRAAGR